jgi:protein-S-isoprenylcysteine O-methyltransferase Ste14
MIQATSNAMKTVTLAGLARAFTNVAVAVWYGLFAYAHLTTFLRQPRASLALIVALEALFAFFILIRSDAEQASFSPWDWFTTIVGTLAPLFLRPSGASRDLLAGQILQVSGACLAVYGILSLNRSVGLVPAHRGIKAQGPYGWVRHPLYCAYTLMNAGYLISNFTALNLFLVVLALVFAILRILNEERFLSRYPDYADYKLKTRWRLLPFVF